MIIERNKCFLFIIDYSMISEAEAHDLTKNILVFKRTFYMVDIVIIILNSYDIVEMIRIKVV